MIRNTPCVIERPGSPPNQFFRLLIRCPYVMAAVVLLALTTSLPAEQSHIDKSEIVALWLFDEPHYPTMTLTDAGPNYWDLRLNTDCASLVPGRFGNALRLGHENGIATQWAMGCNAHQSRLSPYPHCPRDLVRLLGEEDWTLECWLRLDAKPDREVVVLSLGPLDSGPILTLSLSRGGSPFILRSSYPQFDYQCVTNPATLTDGNWHHVAFTFTRPNTELHHFLDGEPLLVGMPKLGKPHFNSNPVPGLIAVEHDDVMLGAPVNVTVADQLNWHSQGAPCSRQYQGQLRVPVHEEITFTVEADDAVRLEIDGHVVIERCKATGPTSGSLLLDPSKGYEIDLKTFHPTEGSHHVTLFWSWTGQSKHVIPSHAFTHKPYRFKSLAAEAQVFRQSQDEGFVFSVGRDVKGKSSLNGQIDELCLSRGSRYRKTFVPVSLSRRWNADTLQSAAPSGPKPLALDNIAQAFQFGKRKHVFIDDMLVERLDNVVFRVNPPVSIDGTDLVNDRPWDPLCYRPWEPEAIASGSSILQVKSCYDHDGKVRLVYSNGGIWTRTENVICIAESQDGLHFTKPELNRIQWRGSTKNNIISLYPGQGSFIVDTNPAVPQDERFKFVSFGMERGVHVFTSSDGLEFVRNETTGLFSDIGGGVEPYWDDQRGEYGIYLRHEGFVRGNRGAEGRAAFLVRTDQLLAPWSLPKLLNPEHDKITEEYPIPFQPNESGQVYRTRAIKYEWAPDVYLAFPWRMLGDHVIMQSELATSRDGIHWTFHGVDPAYLNVKGAQGKALATQGLVRRGDEIWQYAAIENSQKRELVRVTQRLDGFTCFSAGSEDGTLLTKPLVFSGNKLSINVTSRGSTRIAIVNPDGSEVPGFGLDDCQPIQCDSTSAIVQWKKSPALSILAGYIVRVKFEMKDADLYAFTFQ